MTGPETIAPRGLPHMPALDGLRGVAVLTVVAFHTFAGMRGSWSNVISGGALGVDLFFVLSGFLITSLLLRERSGTGRIDMVGFYLRRGFRLLPALLVVLAYFVLYSAVGPPALGQSLRTSFWVLVYGFNWAKVAGLGGAKDLDHLWSLSIEEQFYLVWPAMLLVLARFKPRLVMAFLLIVAAASAVLRFAIYDGGDVIGAHLRTDARADAMIIGALVAMVLARRTLNPGRARAAGRLGALVFGILVLVPNAMVGTRDDRDDILMRGGLTVAALACAAMVAAIASGAWSDNRVLMMRPLRAVGRVSYGLYLWHLPAIYLFARHAQGIPTVARAAGAVVLMALATVASWFMIERPAKRMRVAIEERRSRPEPAPRPVPTPPSA